MSVSEEDIVRGLKTLARLIDAYGDAYWPIFERLEQELERVQSRTSRISKYLEHPSQPRFSNFNRQEKNYDRQQSTQTEKHAEGTTG